MQVLRTPDFRNCKAAHEIQKREFFMMHNYIPCTRMNMKDWNVMSNDLLGL